MELVNPQASRELGSGRCILNEALPVMPRACSAWPHTGRPSPGHAGLLFLPLLEGFATTDPGAKLPWTQVPEQLQVGQWQFRNRSLAASLSSALSILAVIHFLSHCPLRPQPHCERLSQDAGRPPGWVGEQPLRFPEFTPLYSVAKPPPPRGGLTCLHCCCDL